MSFATGARIRLSGRLLLTIGLVALVIFLCLGGFLLFTSLGLQNAFGEADLAVELRYPSTVAVGDTFELTATVRNTAGKDVTLSEIQLPKSLLEGIEVLSADPAGGIVDYVGQIGYEQSILLAPGQAADVTFTLQALFAGEFSGNLRALSGTRSVNAPLAIRVEPGPAAQSDLLAVTPPQ